MESTDSTRWLMRSSAVQLLQAQVPLAYVAAGGRLAKGASGPTKTASAPLSAPPGSDPS